MTLPSRKKLPTTVLNIRSRAKALKRRARRGLLAGLLLASGSASLAAQSPGWQPSRLPAAPSIQPLTTSQPHSAAAAAAQPARSSGRNANANANANASAGASGSGVQLRWRASSRGLGSAPSEPSNLNSASAVLEHTNSAQSSGQQSHRISDNDASNHLANDAWLANPLRDDGTSQPSARHIHASNAHGVAAIAPAGASNTGFSAARSQPVVSAGHATANRQMDQRGSVRMAAYQPPGGGLQIQSDQAQGGQLSGNAQSAQPQFLPQTLPPSQSLPMPGDPLTQPELPPVPPADANAPGLEFPGTQPGAAPSTPFNSPMPQSPNGQALNGQSPSDRAGEAGAANRAANQDEEFDQLGRPRTRPDSMAACETFRENLRNATLDKVNLNSAPRYGQGLSVGAEMAEKMRLEFASTSEVRDWCDREGRTLVRGRMVDLRNEQVALDINGSRREIPLRNLCDVDMAYIGRAWNLPISCGSGYEIVPGRDFVPSAMQWKASGLCHKPLYFEEVQLERYGHEIGPLLQPVVSTVHFFGNIAVLPYKMGIHPPHECQYALGYYRPGDCAPYMLPPIPISLRGAAVQAGVVVGASALIP